MKALVFYVDNGNGFKSPAVSIAQELGAAGFDARAAEFFKEINAPKIDQFLLSGWRFMQTHQWFFALSFFINNTPLYHLTMIWALPLLKKRIIKYLRTEKPDVIFVTHFVASYFIERIAPALRPLGIPVYGYNSEVIIHHLTYGKNKHSTGYFVPTEEGRQAMLKAGMPAHKTHLVGFPIDAKYRKKFGSIAQERQVLGLRDQFTLMLTFGGEGIGDWEIIPAIVSSGLPIQVVAICGKSQVLFDQLQSFAAAHPDFPLVVKGFTTNVQDYLYCSDISAGKSGLNSVFEAIYLERPFLVLMAMKNEAYCAHWLVDHGYGWWPKGVAGALEVLTSCVSGSPALAEVRQRLSVPPCNFGASDLLPVILKEMNALKTSALRSAKALCFDLAGTLCDIPIGDKWDAVNIAGISNVLTSIGADQKFSADRVRAMIDDFIAEKVRLRKEAKVSLREYEIRDQVKSFFEQQSQHHADFAQWLAERSLTAQDWVEIEYQFIKPELDITLPLEGAPELLASLKGRYPLYLLSNNVSRVLVEKIVEKTGLAGYFDEIIVSSEVGYRKPHAAFVKATERVTGRRADECVMIGDRLTQDIEMANQAGMLSIHVAMVDHEDNAGAGHISATIKVHALEEIRSLFA